jgi:hypothetical protein
MTKLSPAGRSGPVVTCWALLSVLPPSSVVVYTPGRESGECPSFVLAVLPWQCSGSVAVARDCLRLGVTLHSERRGDVTCWALQLSATGPCSMLVPAASAAH